MRKDFRPDSYLTPERSAGQAHEVGGEQNGEQASSDIRLCRATSSDESCW
jgi:hypothetical protein